MRNKTGSNCNEHSIRYRLKKAGLIICVCALPLCLAAQGNEDNLAMQYYQEGNYQQAAVLLEKLYSKTKDEAYFNFYFSALLKSRQYQEAEKITRKLIRQNPESLKYEAMLGKIYKEQGQQENAAKAFDHLVSALPKQEVAIRELANDLYQMAEYDLAVKIFIRGRKLFGDEQLFTFELISLYRYKRDKEMLTQEYLNALSASPQILPQAESSFSTVFENDADYLNLQHLLLKKIQKDATNEAYVKLLIWQFLQRKEYDQALRQLIALDKRIKDDGELLFENAQIFVSNKAWSAAAGAYTYLITKGKSNPYYLPARLKMIDTQYQLLLAGKKEEKDILALANQYQSILDEFGKTPQTVFAVKRWATLQAHYLRQLDQAEEALENALKIPGITSQDLAEIKLELGDIYALTGQPWEAILMYGQVAKAFENQDAGNEAKYRVARLSFFQGNFTYAKSQADVLKASTTQLIANDALNLSLLLSDHLEAKADTLALKMYAEAEFLQFRDLSSAALLKLDSIQRVYPENSLADDILMSKSRIYISKRDFSQAALLLKQLTEHPQGRIWTDDALFTLARLYEEELNDPAQAKILYQRLITDFPGSMFTAEARRHFRKLRGDNIES